MTFGIELARQRGPSGIDTAALGVSIGPEDDIVHQGKLFLEHARIDPRRANILIQLAESVGDQIDSLPGYIDMLLAQPENERERRRGWLVELGMLERRL